MFRSDFCLTSMCSYIRVWFNHKDSYMSTLVGVLKTWQHILSIGKISTSYLVILLIHRCLDSYCRFKSTCTLSSLKCLSAIGDAKLSNVSCNYNINRVLTSWLVLNYREAYTCKWNCARIDGRKGRESYVFPTTDINVEWDLTVAILLGYWFLCCKLESCIGACK